jgi:hypothetical protein
VTRFRALNNLAPVLLVMPEAEMTDEIWGKIAEMTRQQRVGRAVAVSLASSKGS